MVCLAFVKILQLPVTIPVHDVRAISSCRSALFRIAPKRQKFDIPLTNRTLTPTYIAGIETAKQTLARNEQSRVVLSAL